MEQIINEAQVQQFQGIAKNPAEALYLSQTVLIQKRKNDPKVERQLFMSGVGIYICHKGIITRRFLYRLVKTVVVALLSGECLIMLKDPQEITPDLLIDSFEFRQYIVNLIMRFNKHVDIIYKEETVLEKYITIYEKGKLKSTPASQPTELAVFKQLMETYKKQLIISNIQTILKEYALLSVIHENDKTKIYYALHKPTKTHVAIKVQEKKVLRDDPKVIEKIILQRDLHEKIHSSFVCQLHRCFMATDRLFWVFEYLPSKTLRSLISRMKTFPEQHLQLYIGEIAIAIGTIHQFGYSYNNLTTDHIMLDAKGHIKLINLRNCADLDQYSDNAPPASYKSPERIQHQHVINQATSPDWWSLGIVMYQLMFLGRYPFVGDTQSDIEKSIIKDELPLSDCNCSSKCIDLLKALLNKNPLERLGTKNGYRQILAHPFFENCKQTELSDRTHSTYFCSKGQGKYTFKTELELSMCKDEPENRRLDSSLGSFDYSANT